MLKTEELVFRQAVRSYCVMAQLRLKLARHFELRNAIVRFHKIRLWRSNAHVEECAK